MTALHLMTEGVYTPGDPPTWRYACRCGASFESEDRDLAVEAYRLHRTEPALGEGT